MLRGAAGSLCSLPSLLKEHWVRAKYEQQREFTHPRSRSPTLQDLGEWLIGLTLGQAHVAS
ncbi:hypothetical protein MC885_009511 [Smutsia gigantea]|nr:hypothetical protein MC885_009511 [Smutsia gigantea]